MQKMRIVLLLLMAAPLPSLAQGQLSVLIDGHPVSFDQPPVMQGGRVLVPLRGIFERLGADVHYDAATRHIQATKGPLVVELTLGSQRAVVSGRPVTLDTPADTIGGRTVVPLRFVSESFGADVRWLAASRTIEITSAVAPTAAPIVEGRRGASEAPPPLPPVDVNLLPPEGSTMNLARPRIGAAFSEPFRFESLRLRLDDQDLPPAEIQHNATGLQWIPNYDLADGPHHVGLEALTASNQEVRQRWKFDVVSGRALIQGVEFNPPGPFVGGQTFQIVAHAAPHGICTVDLGGRLGLHMDEVALGVYRTSYTVANEDRGVFPLVAHFGLRDGRKDMLRSERPVGLNVPYTAQITSPLNGQRVGPSFPLRGQTFPYAQVEVHVTSQQAIIPGVVSVPGGGDKTNGVANPSGFFEIMVPASNIAPGAPLTVRVRAFDQQGHSSPPAVLQLVRQ